jgi:hypothetical protein
MAWVRRNGETPSGIRTGGTGGAAGPATASAGSVAPIAATTTAASTRDATHCCVNFATHLTIDTLCCGVRPGRRCVLERDDMSRHV